MSFASYLENTDSMRSQSTILNDYPTAFLFQNIVSVDSEEKKPRKRLSLKRKQTSTNSTLQDSETCQEDIQTNANCILRDLSNTSHNPSPTPQLFPSPELLTFHELLQPASHQLVRKLHKNHQLFATEMQFESDDEGEQQSRLPNWVQFENQENYDPVARENRMQMLLKLDGLKLLDQIVRNVAEINGLMSQGGYDCRICGKGFATGRQLGGHVSRKHPGSSDSFNRKKKIQKIKTGEKKRREYFRGLTETKFQKKFKQLRLEQNLKNETQQKSSAEFRTQSSQFGEAISIEQSSELDSFIEQNSLLFKY